MRLRFSNHTALLFPLAAAFAVGCGSATDSLDASSGSDIALASSSSPAQLNLCVGEPATISGVVEALGIPGEGLTINTGAQSVTVFGLGPARYWSQNGMARPQVGDAVVAVISQTTASDDPMLLSISIDGQTLELRDSATCTPLFSGRRVASAPAIAAQTSSSSTLTLVSCVGSPATMSGVIESMAVPGGGLTINTGDALESVFGLGPVWYWNQQGVSRPTVGDSVEVLSTYVSTVDYPVILSITVNGAQLDLRDASTCAPLW